MAKCVITNPVGRVFPIHVDREDMFFKWEIEEYIQGELAFINVLEGRGLISETATRMKEIVERMQEYFLPED